MFIASRLGAAYWGKMRMYASKKAPFQGVSFLQLVWLFVLEYAVWYSVIQSLMAAGLRATPLYCCMSAVHRVCI